MNLVVQNIEPKTWVWSTRHDQQVKVLEVEHLWGEDIAVIQTLDDQVFKVPLHTLDNRSNGLGTHRDGRAFLQISAVARLKEHLNRPDTLVSPLNPTLIPLPHQLIHLENALEKPQLRLLIGDEVGLGKTITASLIVQELRSRGEIKRVLILTPSGLVTQWASELREHFGIKPTIMDRRTLQVAGPELWETGDTVLTGYDSVKPMERRNWSEERNAEFNRNRFEALMEQDWDLVIIDEAHRVAGATEGVARNKLARSVAASFPRLLLLTGTPHHGNPKQFLRLMELLDSKTFHSQESVSKEQVRPFVLRAEKRNATDMEGNSLFVDRQTKIVPTKKSDLTDGFASLMENATKYIRDYYNIAETELVNRNPELYKMLLILIQRRLASSTLALESSLRRRLEYLKTGKREQDPDEGRDEEDAHPPPDALFVPAIKKGPAIQEVREIERLLEQVDRAKGAAPDPKYRSLRSLIRDIRMEHGKDTKIIIFTEFIDTQRMLSDTLTSEGETVSQINGTMNIDERTGSINSFRQEGTCLVTTEAGGEGLNLQFCHILINYDLPWNPMRIEQRIGRVHRIGQKKPVHAFNLVLEGTIEHRVIERIGEKLASILEQSGLDKLTDVLDVADLNGEFESIESKASTMTQAAAEQEVEALLNQIKERIQEVLEERPPETEEIDLARLQARLDVPVDRWAMNILNAEASDTKFDSNNPQIQKRLSAIPVCPPEEPIPSIKSPLDRAEGTWSLWRLRLTDGLGSTHEAFEPLLQKSDGENPVLAKRVWDKLSLEPMTLSADLSEKESTILYKRAKELSDIRLRETNDRLVSQIHRESEKQLQRAVRSIDLRREAVERHGLHEVRKHRRRSLEDEEAEARRQHDLRTELTPDLSLVLIAKLEARSEKEND